MKKIRLNTKQMFSGTLLFVVFTAVSWMIVMASGLNPWSKQLTHLDSAVWISRAIQMNEGAVLYRDVWDHKGPVLFFIQCLGLRLTPHSLTGIWLLEWIAMGLTIWFFYLTARLFTEKKVVSALAAVAAMEPLGYFFQQGNCVEEWALPFISLSLYFFVRFMQTGEVKTRQIGATAACMMCAFFLNGNLVAVWMVFVPAIFLILLFQKKFSEIIKCAAAYLGGIAVIVIPVLIYFAANGALGDFWRAYFGFNEGYIAGVGLVQYYYSAMNFAYKDNWFLLAHIIFALILFKKLLQKELRWEWLLFLYTGASLIMLSLSGRQYIHYGIQLIPCMIVPCVFCFRALMDWCENNLFLLAAAAAVVFVVWLRFDLADYWANEVAWLQDESVTNYYACGELSDYQVINEWTGTYTEEELANKVWVYVEPR